MKKNPFIIACCVAFCLMPVFACLPVGMVFAKTDLSLSETDITFSKDTVIAGDMVRVYARVFNIGDADVMAYVDFFNNGKEVGAPQTISIRPNTYDDVFVDWKATAGDNNISAKIIGSNPADDNVKNNVTVKKEVLVDTDLNKNGVPDAKDTKDAKNAEVLKATQVALAEQETKKTEITVPTNNVATQSGGVFDKYAVVYQQIQKGIESFTESLPVQAVSEFINNATGGKAGELFQAATGKINSSIAGSDPAILDGVKTADLNYSKSSTGFWDVVKSYIVSRAPQIYYLFGGLGLLILLLLFKNWRKDR